MNYYDILDIDSNATEAEIRKAYHKLALIYHPDKPNGDPEKFRQIHIAYEILSNKDKRKQYDGMDPITKIKYYDMLNHLMPTKYNSLFNTFIDFFYKDNKQEFENDINNLAIHNIKKTIYDKLNDCDIFELLCSNNI